MRSAIPAAFVPLFDRFGTPVFEPLGPGLQDAAGLQESLARDLHRLLSTKCSSTVQAYLNAETLTVLDYGVPDLSGLSLQSSEDLLTIAAVIRKALEAFEPRLHMLEISCSAYPNSHTRMLVDTAGAVMLAGQLHRVSFEMSNPSDQALSVRAI